MGVDLWMLLFKERLMPELQMSSEEKGAVSGEEARRSQYAWCSDELDEEVEDVPMLELGLLR